MGIEDIKKKIINDANEKKQELLSQANLKKEEILSDFKKRAAEYKTDMMDKSKAEGESLKRGIIIDARQKVKNEVLKKKRETIQEVFDTVKKDMIVSKDYPDFIKSLAISAVETKNEEVIISGNEKKLDKKWLDSLNKEVKGALKFTDEKGEFSGGLILKNGEAYINITIETLLQVIREDVEKEIADILFLE